MSELLGIGDLSRVSGLPVSALRYYDTHDVLVPAVIDERTGYRRYSSGQVVPARVLAGLRRIGLPVADMRAVLGRLDDREQVRSILEAHVDRMEADLVAARADIPAIMSLIDSAAEGPAERLTFPVAAFRAALASVGYAAAGPEGEARLGGVRLETEAGVCTWTATDRHRLATTATPVSEGRWVGTVPLDTLRGLLDRAEGGVVTLPGDVEIVDGDYPDVSVLRSCLGRGRVWTTSRAELLGSLDHAEDGVRLDGVLLDEGYLREAVEALPEDDVLVELRGLLAPLVLRHPVEGATWSMLMPKRPDRP